MKYVLLLIIIATVFFISCEEVNNETFYEEAPFPDQPVFDEKTDFIQYRFNEQDYSFEENQPTTSITAIDRNNTIRFHYDRSEETDNPMQLTFTVPKIREEQFGDDVVNNSNVTFKPNTGSIFAVKAQGNDLYVGGSFGTASDASNDITATRIAKWDGINWEPLGQGLNGRVRVIAVAPNGDLYVGGDFTHAGGNIARRIAKYDGAWSSIGIGFDGPVYDIAISSTGETYAGGEFIASGTDTLNHIAKWNSASGKWDSLGNGLNRTVHALAVDNNDILYAGGDFIRSGDAINVRRLAKWDTAWSEVGGGTDGTIRDIAVGLNNEIYIAGSFTASGSVSTRRVGVWENGSWTGFGDGLSKTARSISVADNGNLIVGGEFSMAGSVEANRVAVWDGSGWSALGDGVNGTVHAVETVGNDVFVGGEFIKSGAITSNRIAKWNGNWSALGTGVRIDYTITAGGQLTLTYLTSVGVGGTFKFLFRNNIGEESFISGNFLSHFE